MQPEAGGWGRDQSQATKLQNSEAAVGWPVRHRDPSILFPHWKEGDASSFLCEVSVKTQGGIY